MNRGAIGPGSIEAIIFDFDGVILDNARVKDEAFCALFADYPEHQPRIAAHHREHLGVSRFEKFEWIFTHLLGKPLSDNARADLGRRFSELVLAETLASPFVPGALALLQQLAERLPLFVASGTPQEELDVIVDQRRLRPYFREVHGTPPGKPELVAAIVREHELDPPRVLMIGDGLSDLEAARAAGCRFIARADPAATDQMWPPGTEFIQSLEPLSRAFS